jgi:hypothetical protein
MAKQIGKSISSLVVILCKSQSDNSEHITLVGLTAILKEMWSASEKADIDIRERVLALSLAKEVYSMKLDLLSDVSTVEAAMKFISDYKSKESLDSKPNSEQSIIQ